MPDELTITANVGPLTRLGALLELELTKALEQLKEETVSDARGRAPVKTGFLRDNISGSVTTGPGMVIATIVSAAPYSGFVDMGTRRMAARPFFTPAVDQARSKLGELAQEAFREALRRAR
jgi:HK97 gp10 family phage protein